MSRRWTIWRYLIAGIACGSIILAAKCFVDAHRWAMRFDQWRIDKPVDAAVDLSQAGEFVVPLHNTCSVAHGLVIAVGVPDASNRRGINQMIADAQARIEVCGKGRGDVVAAADLGMIRMGDSPDEVPAFHLRSFEKGEYDARLTVTQGVPALRGVGLRLQGSYSLCGLEKMPGIVVKTAGVVLLILGAVLAAVLVCMLVWVPVRRETSLPRVAQAT